jgi:hypothetical protein
MRYVGEIVVSCCKLNSFNLYGGSEEEKYNSNSKSPARIPVRCIPNMKQLCESPNRGAVYKVGLKDVSVTVECGRVNKRNAQLTFWLIYYCFNYSYMFRLLPGAIIRESVTFAIWTQINKIISYFSVNIYAYIRRAQWPFWCSVTEIILNNLYGFCVVVIIK